MISKELEEFIKEEVKAFEERLRVKAEELQEQIPDKPTGIFYLLRKSDKGENNMKKIFEVYRGYGRGYGKLYVGLDSMIVKEDTLENREEIFEDEFGHWDCFDGKEEFLNGESNSVDCERYGRDWDEFTCGYIIVTTKEEKLEEIRKQYEKNTDEVIRLFEGE